MSDDEDLQRFVRNALGRGLPRAQVEAALASAGWPADRVRRALAAYAEIDFPVPVPRPRPYLSAREAFLYLLLFTALYVSAFNLGALAFAFLDRWLPDPAWNRSPDLFREAVRWSTANLIVAFPLYLALTISRERALAKDPAKRASRVRKWLTYLTLFIGAAVLLGDVIALVHGVLRGDPTLRFILKCVVVAVIAGTAFAYYLWDLRQDEREDVG
jgi:hypothetical protein